MGGLKYSEIIKWKSAICFCIKENVFGFGLGWSLGKQVRLSRARFLKISPKSPQKLPKNMDRTDALCAKTQAVERFFERGVPEKSLNCVSPDGIRLSNPMHRALLNYGADCIEGNPHQSEGK